MQDQHMGSSAVGARVARAVVAVTLIILTVAALCVPADAQPDRPVVSVALAFQEFAVRELFGDALDARVLIPPGQSHESYEPTIRQLKAFSASQAYLRVGHPRYEIESVWLQTLLAERPSLRIVDCARGIDLADDDIHYWTAPPEMKQVVENIATGLLPLVPGSDAEVERRKRDLLARIDAADAAARVELAPFKGRSFLVFHPSWGYFARHYGLVQLALEHEGKEPGPRYLDRILAAAKRDSLKVVFIEPAKPRHSAEAVARELGAKIETIDPLATDWLANLQAVTRKLTESFR